MKESRDRVDLDALEARLKKVRAEDEAKRNRQAAADQSALGKAWRISIELVVAVGVSGAIGWYLDKWLGTRPWLFVIFFFLGVAAGFRNVYKAAQKMGETPSPKQDEK